MLAYRLRPVLLLEKRLSGWVTPFGLRDLRSRRFWGFDMKNIAYLMIAAGFLGAAYATSLHAQQVDWTLFVISALISTAGVIIAKRMDSADARSESVLNTNRAELNESIANIVTGLDDTAYESGEQLRDWIDEQLRPDLRRFADARESMVHLYGLQTYADIMSNFATGERYINRVWSASADGYDSEAATYLEKAAGQFAEAQTQLSSVA